MRYFNKLKSMMLVAASLFCFNEAFADTALIAWGCCTAGSYVEGSDVKNQLTGKEGDTAEGFVLQLTGNPAKAYSAGGVKFSVPLPDGTSGSRTPIKLSNGAQNTVILPAGKVATKVTFHSYLNYDPAAKGKEGRTPYWKEVAGDTYTEETATIMNCWLNGKTIGDPDVISFDLNKVSSFTFTNTGEQTCVILSIEYEDAPAVLEGLTVATAVAAGSDPDTVKVDFTVKKMGTVENPLYIYGQDGSILSGVKYGMNPMAFNPVGFDEMGLLKVEDGQVCHWEILVPKANYGEGRSECDATLAFSLVAMNEESFEMTPFQSVKKTVHFDSYTVVPALEDLNVETVVAAGSDPDTVKVDFWVVGSAENPLYIYGQDGSVLSGVKYGMNPMAFNPVGFDEMGLLKVEDGLEYHLEILVPKISYGEGRSECDATLAFHLVAMNEESFEMTPFQTEERTIHFAGATIVETITLDQEAVEIEVGNTATLMATCLPADAVNAGDVEWTSENEAVATVENGVITAVATGTTTITAAIEDIVATCSVTVVEAKDETQYVLYNSWNFRDANAFPKDTRVTTESLTEAYDTVPGGIMLYKSTNEIFAGLVFEPTKDNNTNSWWVRSRNSGTDYGLAAVNQKRWFAIQNVYEGFKVTVEAKSAMPLADSTMVSSIVKNDATECGHGVSYTYTIAKAGMLAFFNEGCYMYQIKVEAPILDRVVDSEWNFRDEAAFPKDTRVTRASLVTEYDTVPGGIMLYESTLEAFAGLAFEPTKDDNTNSWWVRQRNTGTDWGLAAINQSRWFAVTNLKAGSTVTVEAKSAMPLADSTIVSSIVKNDATECGSGVSYTYTMAKDGMLAFYNQGCYMYLIRVEKPVTYYEIGKSLDFRNEAAFPKDTRVTVASLVTEYDTVPGGIMLYESTLEAFAGLAFEPAKDDNTKSWWVRQRNTGTDWGLAAVNQSRWFAVTNLKPGEYVTIEAKSAMRMADSTMVSEIVQNETTRCGYGVSYTYKIAKKGMLAFYNEGCYMYLIETQKIGGGLAAPTIKVEGSEDDVNTVTIACETEGAIINYSIDGGETIVYTAPFAVDTVCTVAAWSEVDGTVSSVVRKPVTAGYIKTPTAVITAVNGTERTVTLSCATEGATISYKTNAVGSEFAIYTEPIVIADTTVFTAVASKASAIVEGKMFYSVDTMNTTLGAGEMVSLNAPTYGKVSYNEETQESVYTIAADQSSVLCAPTATITYEFFKRDAATGRVSDVADKSGTYEGELTLPLGKLVATAKADGYLPAESHLWIKAPADLTEVWSVDFDTLGAPMGDKYNPIVLTEVIAHENATDLVRLQIGDSIPTNFLVYAGSQGKWLIRTGNTTVRDTVITPRVDETGAPVLGEDGVQLMDTVVNATTIPYGKGLYLMDSGHRNIGVTGVSRNQLVKLYIDNRMGAGNNGKPYLNLIDNGVAELDVTQSDEENHVYRIVKSGTLSLTMGRYNTLHTVTIYDDPSVTAIPTFDIARCDGGDRYVSIASRTLGADIYYALGKEEYGTHPVVGSIDTILVSEATEELEAVYRYDTTWVEVIDTTIVYGDYQLYAEPIRISETTHFMAYATYQDMDSEAITATIEAGVTVQVAQPVIKYIETVEGGKKFAITVDNKNVVSNPKTPIYYTLPGGEKTLYTEPIVVANDVYGWMTAVAELEGYESSATANRYIDSRESYAEVYEAVVATSTVMPKEAADLEFADAVTIHVEQEEVLNPSGRIYFHRNMHAGYNSLVLPFNMTTSDFSNGAVKVTDAKGKTLTRGVDYTVYKMAAAGLSGKDFSKLANDSLLAEESMIHTANLVGNTQSYLIAVADEYVGQDLIFVSKEGQAINVAQNSFDAQPTEGWKLVTNRRFQKAVAEVPVYLVNEKGDALVRHEAGTEIPAFTAVVIADAEFTEAHDKIVLIDNSFKPVYKNIAEDTIFLPTQENMETANAEKWARNGDEANGWNTFHYVTTKNATIDPTTGEECSKTKFPGVGIKNNGPKNVYFYVTNVASFTAYIVSTGGDTERTATCTATATDGTVVTGTASSVQGTSTTLVMALDPSKSYELKFEADADMMLYGINFTSGRLDGIESIEINRFETGVIYDMMGRKVQEVKAGEIYIRDGKKFMQK